MLQREISSCTHCEQHLQLGPRPVVQFSSKAKMAIIGQAPGLKVHQTGIPWNDASGKRLREWMNVDDELFYDSGLFAIVPMAFCYPGKGKSGDLPPRKECAPLWHSKIFEQLPNLESILLIGNYAQKYYLGASYQNSLTENVRDYKSFAPKYWPLPHPSPRNNIWLKKNEWFEQQIIPELQQTIHRFLLNHL